MTTMELHDLVEQLDDVLDAVRHGDTVSLRDGERPVAAVVPQEPHALEARIDMLVRQGKLRRNGTGEIPKDFLDRPRPKLDGMVDALIADRYADDDE